MYPASLAAFALASIVLAVTPGPGIVYIVTRTLAQRRRAGFASVAGVALGNSLNAAAASLGLAALLAVSRWAFTALQVAGALYLFWLGVQAWRAPAPDDTADGTPLPAVAPWVLFRDGAIMALLNPKTALFFAAFLPQFIAPGPPALPQALTLGLLFVSIAACSDALYVAAATRVASHLARWRGFRTGTRIATAAVFVLLGVASLVAGQRPPR